MTMETVESPIILRINNLLNDHDFKQVHKVILDVANEEIIKENAWDLIPVICTHLVDDTISENVVDTGWCEKILEHLASIGNPKELLLGFLEQSDHLKKDVCFKVLLKPVQTVLQKLPGKRGRSLEWTLNTFNVYVQQLPLPLEYNLEENEKVLLDLDPNVSRICSVVSDYIPFFEPFVEEISIKTVNEKEVTYVNRVINQRIMLARFLLKIFDRPLVFLDLSCEEGKAKSTQFICCEKTISLLSQMFGNCFAVYDLVPKIMSNLWLINKSLCDGDIKSNISNAFVNNSSQNELGELSIANMAYLIFGEGLNYNFLPHVYSHQYLLLRHLNLIISLLSQDASCIVYKGLKLSKAILCFMHYPELTTEHLEMLEFKVFPKLLVKVMVYCPVKEYHQIALKVFLKYISKFEMKGCYNILLYLIKSQKHSGFQGLVIGLYKNNLCHYLSNQEFPNYFLGENLHNFLNVATELPEDVETDILEHSDRIITVLNFLRFLFLRDKIEENVTGVWNYVESIRTRFLKPLHKGIDLSRGHYKLEANQTEERSKLIKRNDILNATVSANGQTLPSFLSDHEMKVLRAALLTFDLIESILVRIDELT